MPSSNILLFDANKANMMSDEQYSTNTQRLNGVQSGIASSQLQNKTLYQVSLVAYAIAQIMNQNGFNANDTAAVSAFVANLSSTMLQKVADLASTQEAQAGVATGKWMSPALVKAAINYMKATTSEAQAGTNDTKWMSPALVKTAINYFKQNAVTFGNTVTLNGDPTSNLQAATKQYVDNNVSGLFQIVTWTGDDTAPKTLTFNGTPQLVLIASSIFDSDSRDVGRRVFGFCIRGCSSAPMGYNYNTSRIYRSATSWGSNYITLNGSGISYGITPNASGHNYLAFAFLS